MATGRDSADGRMDPNKGGLPELRSTLVQLTIIDGESVLKLEYRRETSTEILFAGYPPPTSSYSADCTIGERPDGPSGRSARYYSRLTVADVVHPDINGSV
jgi:hypothetical protein